MVLDKLIQKKSSSFDFKNHEKLTSGRKLCEADLLTVKYINNSFFGHKTSDFKKKELVLY